MNEKKFRHPEQKDDEIFLENDSGWKTKRTGKVAYDEDGNIIENKFPVFMKISEVIA